MNNARQVEIEGRGTVCSLIFFEDGKHFLTGGEDGMIRKWCVDDGKQVGEPIKGNEPIRSLALSGDGKWIVSGEFKLARVWDRLKAWRKVFEVHQQTLEVETVDISPDSTKFATGSRDKKAYIWDILSGKRLLGPLEHDNSVVTVKFSPDGNHIATATWDNQALRIYNTHTCQLIRSVSMPRGTRGFGTIAWSRDSQRIFSSSSGTLNHIYVDTASIISQWEVPGRSHNDHSSLAVPENGRFIASFIDSSLTLWDPSTRERFGPVFALPGRLRAIAISSDNNHLVTCGENGTITIRNLNDIIPLNYLVRHPPNMCEVNQRLQIEAFEAFRGTLRTLELRFAELADTTTQSNSFPDVRTALLQIPNGVYRIKSSIADVYLTCPLNRDGTIEALQFDASNDSQKWTVSHVQDGAYRIVSHKGGPMASSGTGNECELVCISKECSSAWTFEPRRNAFVIGNASNATAIHLVQRPQHVMTLLRNNSQNQRWILERAHNRIILETDSTMPAQ